MKNFLIQLRLQLVSFILLFLMLFLFSRSSCEKTVVNSNQMLAAVDANCLTNINFSTNDTYASLLGSDFTVGGHYTNSQGGALEIGFFFPSAQVGTYENDAAGPNGVQVFYDPGTVAGPSDQYGSYAPMPGSGGTVKIKSIKMDGTITENCNIEFTNVQVRNGAGQILCINGDAFYSK